jgi:ActR/RegA family two-component response regulator
VNPAATLALNTGSGAVRVLAVATDPTTLETIKRALAMEGDKLIIATDVAEAIAICASESPDLAFVDVALEGRAGLALVHHLPAVCSGIAVYAIAPSLELDLGTEALALGASGILIAPPSGDGLLRAVSEVRARQADARERARFDADLTFAKRRGELMERVVCLLEGGDRAQAAGVIAAALAEVSGARGAAIYARKDGEAHEHVRLAAVGSAQSDEDALEASGEQSGEQSGSRVLPLSLGKRLVGYAMLDHASLPESLSLRPLTEMAAAVLVLSDVARRHPLAITTDAGRVYSYSYFEDTAAREIDKAKRHNRRVSIACVLADMHKAEGQSGQLEAMVLGAVRETDVLARRDDGRVFLLLPETGALGAHTCRRRVLEGAERNLRAQGFAIGGAQVAKPSSIRGSLAVGVASYPQDGGTLDRLLRAAEWRALAARSSAVQSPEFVDKSLPEIIDRLLEFPMMGAGPASPYPLDLSAAAALSLVASACHESLRGGGATVLVAAHPGAGFVSVARAVLPDDSGATLHVVDVQEVEGCTTAEAVVIVAEHGTWTMCGRRDGSRFKAVHSADPLLADLVARRLSQAAGLRLG